MVPTVEHYESHSYLPAAEGNELDIKNLPVHMVTSDQFDGYCNPNDHLARFTKLCCTYKVPAVDQKLIYIRVFPFSLCGNAKRWLMYDEPNTFRTWDQLAKAFLMQYFPLGKTKKIRDMISLFTQRDDENFNEAYEHFK